MTCDEVIAVNPAGSAPRQIARENGHAIWVSDALDGGLYVGVFNTSDHQKNVICPANILPQNKTIRDLWARENIGKINGDLSVEFAAHASVLYKIS